MSVRPPVESGISKRDFRHSSQDVCPWNARFAKELPEDSPYAAREALAGKDARTLAREILTMMQEELWTWSDGIFRRSPMPGHATSAAEVTHVSRHGFWLLLGDEELLVRFDDFPWFRKASVEQFTEVAWPTADHLYWPRLDVDLSVRSIRDPRAFPLVSRRAIGDDSPSPPADGPT